MGLLNNFMSLLEEGDDASFEKKMNDALDKIEHVLGATVDKAESSLKKVDAAGKAVEHSVERVEQVSRTTMDVVNKKTTSSS